MAVCVGKLVGRYSGTRIDKQCAGSYCNKLLIAWGTKAKMRINIALLKLKTIKAENEIQSTISYTSENYSVGSLEARF